MSACDLSILAFALAALLGGSAHAGVADVPLRREDRAGVSLSMTATASPQTEAVKTLALLPGLAAAYRVAPRFVLSLDAAMSATSYRFADQERGSVARVANPVLSLQALALDTPSVTLRVGAAAGAPLLTVPGGITNNAAAEHADRAAAAATGQRLYWLWARNAAPLVGLARLAFAAERFALRVDVEPGVLLSVNRNPSWFAVLGAVEPSVRLGAFAPGLRVTSLFTSRQLDTSDFSQTTAAAFLRWDAGRAFASMEAVVGIDGPQGLGNKDQTSWGLTFSVGTRL